jgi:hypothetical protein
MFRFIKRVLARILWFAHPKPETQWATVVPLEERTRIRSVLTEQERVALEACFEAHPSRVAQRNRGEQS